MKQKKRFFNFRLFFIAFMGMIAGILNFYYFLYLKLLHKFRFGFVIFAFSFVCVIVLTVLIYCKFKRWKKYLKYCFAFILCFVVGVLAIFIKWNDIKNYKAYSGVNSVEGIVTNYANINNYYIIDLKNVKVNNDKLKGNMRVYITLISPIPEDLSKGDKISFQGKVNLKSVLTDEVDFNTYVNNCVYSSSIVSTAITYENRSPGVIAGLQERLKYVLNKELSEENAQIAYKVLTGERNEINENVTQAFSYAGISHILAISGLHIGFLVVVLTYLLNLFKVGRRNRFVIISIFLILYTIFCGGVPSVLRASIMTIIMLLGGVLGEEYDMLNALGIAGIIILLISPLDLFGLGFQLSFMCILMIITLADKMSRILQKIKFPEKLAYSISVSFCVTIGTSILCANAMNNVSLVSIISNLVVVPLFGITFPILFTLSIVAMAFPALSVILNLPELFLHLIKAIANFFASINFAHFRLFNLGYLILLVFVIFAILCKYFMADRKIKYPITILLFIIICGLFLGGVKPTVFSTNAISMTYEYDDVSLVISTKDNKKYMIGLDKFSSAKYLTKLKIDHLDGLIIPNFEVNKKNEYIEFLKQVKVDQLLIPNYSKYNQVVLKDYNEVTTVKEGQFYNTDFYMEFFEAEDKVYGTYLEIGHTNFLIPNKCTKEYLTFLGNCIHSSVNYAIINETKYDIVEYLPWCKSVVYHNERGFVPTRGISLSNKSHYVINLGG